ncbi:tRNA uracil 4-sulfurtransferase ThiI [Archaeoglobus neptunius]|uniref:tRNA uracil 4-sulfurtransferase ThiI n=1 Tax=Archaeoglobus neptunius TaxID=2798580 RepID=UPI001927A254|nr:tRNA uracil 4-sulfurtransferase ThiI [Archaeoglobus neptunius]
MEKVVVVHYGEIATKGKNREFFERKLINAIKRATGRKVRRKFGRIEVEYADSIAERLKKIPGIKYFGVGVKTGTDIEEIKKAAIRSLPDEFNSFKVETSRSNKNFPLNSIEINREVGAYIVERTGKGVNLRNPDVTVWIEVCDREVYVYTRKISGVGGLPVGVAGRVVSLVSGGIDSPVASFMAMKRGCEIVAVHFFNRTMHSPKVREKIKILAEKLAEYQGEVRLYMVPFYEIQLEIIKNVPARLRMIVYRRSMMRMANMIAEMEGCKAVITGDNLSQVASQTLDNLNVIYSASKLAVLPPLIGMDKEEIIEIARKIGTYDISILPYDDCCSFMIARHPETRANLEDVTKYESFDRLEREAIEKSEVEDVRVF